MADGFFLSPGYKERLDALLRRFDGGGSFVPGADSGDPNFPILQFKCNAACPAYGVMRITGCTLSDDKWPRFDTVKPDTTFSHRYLVNLGQDAEDGGDSYYYGAGTYLEFSGHVLCDSTYTPTLGQEWGPTSGSWSLVRNRPGFLIDGGATGSGSTYRAVAKQRVVTTILGDLVSDLTQGSSSSVNVFFGNAATGTLEDSSLIITAYDWFLGSGESWDATTRVKADFYSGRWWITQAACSPDSGGGGGGGGGGGASSSPGTIGAGAGADMNGQFYPGGTEYGSAFDIYNEPIEFDSLLGG